MDEEILVFGSSDSELKIWKKYYEKLPRKAVFHSPEYIKIIEGELGEQAELFIYRNGTEFVYYPYLKNDISKLPFFKNDTKETKKYYDIVSSWYYGGPLFNTNLLSDNIAQRFRLSFATYCKTENIICDCKTGVSGAGKKPNPAFHYPNRYDNMNAYKLAGHQHVVEVEQELGLLGNKPVQITFTAQVVPVCRGIMSSLYATLDGQTRCL